MLSQAHLIMQRFVTICAREKNKLYLSLRKKTLSVGSDPDGGYLVPPEVGQRIVHELAEVSILRRLSQVMIIASDAVEMLIDKGRADVGWVGERQNRDETKTPQLAHKRIPVHEMYAKPRATQKLLDDANMNVEEWLAQKVAQRMSVIENNAFLWGNGLTQPQGILSQELNFEAKSYWRKIQGFKTGKDGGFAAENGADVLIEMVTSLATHFLPGSVWLMSRPAATAVRKLKDKNGTYLWQPGLEGDLRTKLLGYPVEICDDLSENHKGQNKNQNRKSIIFGNFKEGYLIVDRQGTRVLRDPYSTKPYVEFYTTRRVGGDIVNADAFKVLEFANR